MSLFKHMSDRLEAERERGQEFEKKMGRDYPHLLCLWIEFTAAVDRCEEPIGEAECARDRFLSELDRLEKIERPARQREEKPVEQVEKPKKQFHHPAFDHVPQRVTFDREDDRGVYHTLITERGRIKMIVSRESEFKPRRGETWGVKSPWLVYENEGFCIVALKCHAEPANLAEMFPKKTVGEPVSDAAAQAEASVEATEPHPTLEDRDSRSILRDSKCPANVMTFSEARRDPSIAWPENRRAWEADRRAKKEKKGRKGEKGSRRDRG